ncbi:hypothetical protein Ae201684P_011411 [Aphanomyces euteiches]|uniref:Uncharacterized protein n=1 Tax=Aphanomyces euteiches TaxID=100861 RepID=A0A6G0XX21_9STRA|nr:hypothetical protein Ae201684_000685 [Aphanomyces euteiches]KAH9091868.1 hypothetical protein Ae201684P_011411 [Aphanomyces euteiches]KAH9157138.1 hypothetical protein AeRB84_001011 [Aphanomyces euteiches]
MFNTSRAKAAPTFKELEEESSRQDTLVFGDIIRAERLRKKTLGAVTKASDRVRRWKDANPGFDASDPRLIALLQEYSDADDSYRTADQIYQYAWLRRR